MTPTRDTSLRGMSLWSSVRFHSPSMLSDDTHMHIVSGYRNTLVLWPTDSPAARSADPAHTRAINTVSPLPPSSPAWIVYEQKDTVTISLVSLRGHQNIWKTVQKLQAKIWRNESQARVMAFSYSYLSCKLRRKRRVSILPFFSCLAYALAPEDPNKRDCEAMGAKFWLSLGRCCWYGLNCISA